MKRLTTILGSIAMLGLASVANAQTWVEVGDAGQTGLTAQRPSLPPPGGPLLAITGTIAGDADMYAINVTSFILFSASTVGTPGTLGDTQLFLFSEAAGGAAFGIAANDDSPGGGTLRSLLPAGNTLYYLLAPGKYFLGISGYDYDPQVGGLDMFPDSPFTGVFGPTGPGGPGPLTGWGVGGGSGTYTIALTGVSYNIPAPGALALLGLAGLVGSRRRRS